MKIYVVTSGEYSSYHICEVFLDKKKAIAYCATRNISAAEYFYIEECETFDDCIEIDINKSIYKKSSVYVHDGIIDFDDDVCYTFAAEPSFKIDDLHNTSKRTTYRVYYIVDINKTDDQIKKIIQDQIEKYEAEKSEI